MVPSFFTLGCIEYNFEPVKMNLKVNQVIKFLIRMMKAFGLHWAGAVNRVHLVGYALMFASQNFGRLRFFSKFLSFFRKFEIFEFSIL